MGIGILDAQNYKNGDAELMGWKGAISAQVCPQWGMMEGTLELVPLLPDEVAANKKRKEIKKKKGACKEFEMKFRPASQRGKVVTLDGVAGYLTDQHGNDFLSIWIISEMLIGGSVTFNGFAYDDETDTTTDVKDVGLADLKLGFKPGNSQAPQGLS